MNQNNETKVQLHIVIVRIRGLVVSSWLQIQRSRDRFPALQVF
jgi:hypothetical protein